MKKIATSILALLLSVSMLASCGRTTTPPSNITEETTLNIETDATEDKDTESETEEKATENKSTDSETPKTEDSSIHSDHVYDNACDADCNECKVIRKVPEHVYDNYCDVDCNECKAIRKVPNHVYDNDCDVDCNECKAIRQVPNHVYDNDCDADCNECKAIRQVSNHVYDNDCDADCNECNVIRKVPNHVYDNDCDADCNECKAIRQVSDHVYDNDCDADCNECKAIRQISNHVYDNDCDADCNECKAIRQVPDHVYDNACDADCNECKKIRQVSAHVYDNACDADCNECKAIRKVPDHVYDNISDIDCNECKTVRELSDLVVTVPPTNFANVFSAKNEDLLKVILNSPIENVSVENLLPTMPITHKIKETAGNGGYTYIYDGVNRPIYESCCEKLLASGYAQYTKNQISGNAYNNAELIVNNYGSTFISTKAQIDIDFHASKGRMYINITPRSASVLRQREAQSYVRAGDKFPTIFVQYGLEDIDTGTQKESSMGYIMRLDDGTFLIIDSGEYYDGVEVRIYDLLKSLAPNPNNIVICAWILTHGHYDHIGGFMKFADKYYNDATIKVKQVVTNFPDDSNCLNSPETSAHYYVRNATAKLKAETLKPHTGNVLYYADIKINILYTQENYLACNADGLMKEYNASSLVMQIETAAKTKIFIAADHPVNGSWEGANWCEGALYVWYGTALQSYVTTTFHHGFGGGADNIIYTVIDARITLWDCDYDRAQEVASYECNQFFLDRPATSIYQCYMACGSSVTILSFNNYMAFATVYPNFPTYQTAMHNIYK